MEVGSRMNNFTEKQQQYIRAIADHILVEGIQKTSLKNMAQAAGTSDRMLMHYFKDKLEIEKLVLTLISEDLIKLLHQDSERMYSFQELLLLLKNAVQSEEVRPYLNLWFEITHLSSGETEPYATVTKRIGHSFWEWMRSVYKEDELVQIEADSLVSLLIVMTEGLVVLDKAQLIPQMQLAVDALLHLYNREI